MDEKEQHLKKDYQSLVKHNNLIKSRYTLNLAEQKLLYKLFETVQKNNYKSKELNLKFENFFLDFKSVYKKKNITKKEFKSLLEGVQEKMPYIIKGDQFIRTQWYKIKGDISYENISLILDDDVFEYIQAQERNYTMLRLESIYSFVGTYTLKIYELIKQWCNTKKVIEFSLEDFKLDLDIMNNKGYEYFYNINKRILEPSVKEINEKSELKIDFEVIRKGRSVQKIRFFILENRKLKNKNIINNDDIYYKDIETNSSVIGQSNSDVNLNNEFLDNHYKDENGRAFDEHNNIEHPIENYYNEQNTTSNNSKHISEYEEYPINNIHEDKTEIKKEEFPIEPKPIKKVITVPEDTVLTAGALRLLKVHFKGYDFTEGANYEAYLEAEALTLDRDNVEEIGPKQYGFFKQTLKNKLETMSINQEKDIEYSDRRNTLMDLYANDNN